MARTLQRPSPRFMSSVAANPTTRSWRVGAALAKAAARIARTCQAVSLALRALRGSTSDYDRRLRALCECDLSELSDAGLAARRQTLRELREIELRARAKRHV
ncbi:MAG TPA: hypothetical protein VHM01_13925 [Alphaproteobacteria bacterium]|nr:hypothetical protein [Alphaproteobacteria bacterium]